MFSTEIINGQEHIFLMGYVLVNDQWKKIEEMKQEKEPRSLERLIKDFRASAGDFEKFNKTMDMREQILFKGWMRQMRREIPKFATHVEDAN
jgi:hypothetical protein